MPFGSMPKSPLAINWLGLQADQLTYGQLISNLRNCSLLDQQASHPRCRHYWWSCWSIVALGCRQGRVPHVRLPDDFGKENHRGVRLWHKFPLPGGDHKTGCLGDHVCRNPSVCVTLLQQHRFFKFRIICNTTKRHNTVLTQTSIYLRWNANNDNLFPFFIIILFPLYGTR